MRSATRKDNKTSVSSGKMMKRTLVVLLLSPFGVAGDGTCGLYLAPSSVKNGGLGVFAGKAFQYGAKIVSKRHRSTRRHKDVFEMRNSLFMSVDVSNVPFGCCCSFLWLYIWRNGTSDQSNSLQHFFVCVCVYCCSLPPPSPVSIFMYTVGWTTRFGCSGARPRTYPLRARVDDGEFSLVSKTTTNLVFVVSSRVFCSFRHLPRRHQTCRVVELYNVHAMRKRFTHARSSTFLDLYLQEPRYCRRTIRSKECQHFLDRDRFVGQHRPLAS